MSKSLLIWLEGPLQTWGDSSRFGRRETVDFPTASGLFGLLNAAQGISHPTEEEVEAFYSLEMSVDGYSKNDRYGESVSTIITDYHTVGGGFDESNPVEALRIPKKSDGKKVTGTGTRITRRDYLQSRAFAVVLTGDGKVLDQYSKALCEPVWDLYLGRKCCIPTEFLFQGLFDGHLQSDEKVNELVCAKGLSKLLSVRVAAGEGELRTLNDRIFVNSNVKRYSTRTVAIQEFGDVNEDMG
ncbi:type I-E CRISPR-associated protein Cas5/CasD [Vibrio barjaei]|uniref:type I-E CRISPR-associated protein Cas5/CasD n=1 Tax=Vibrio barjaei TaxID=1676683 RepID=UPI0022848A92|nr:type I-E CRISPR-associated protein Cas5/CasD [Vibrio barjaei]MCY9874526.1 type I-E CRISPR-associated protein Cas5/CasD [Vibrio barjaei]